MEREQRAAPAPLPFRNPVNPLPRTNCSATRTVTHTAGAAPGVWCDFDGGAAGRAQIENFLLKQGVVKLCDFGSATTRAKAYTNRKEILDEEENIR